MGYRSYRDLDVKLKSIGNMRSISSWTPSDTSWIKLNSNGAMLRDESLVSIMGD